MTDQRIRPCAECERPTRSSHMTAVAFPGTVVRGNRTQCVSCYAKLRRLAGTSRPKAAPQEVILASVPDDRAPQQSDCRVRCCKTPFTCAQRYLCACHRRPL